MRGLPSSIPLPMRHLGRPALPWVARPHLDPRSRSRRLVVVFGSGGTASSVRCCDGVARGPAGASAGRRGGPKGWERLARLRPSFKSWSGVREPCAAGALGRAPQSSVKLRSPWGLCPGRHGKRPRRARGKKRVLLRVREASLPISRSRPTGSLRSCRSSYFGWPGLVQKTRRDCQKAPRESA